MPRILLIFCFMLISNVGAEIYKWKDDQGNVHYSDSPRDNHGATELKLHGSTVKTDVTGSRAETREKLLQAMEEDRIEKKEQREKKKAKAKRDRARCNALRDKMRRMKRASGVYRLDKDGNRVFISKEQRGKSEDRLSKQIRKYCR